MVDNQEVCWVEDEEDGAEGFFEAAFWVCDEENYTWLQRGFQGRKTKRGCKDHRKGKGNGRKGSGGRCFFKKRKGRSHLTNDTTDAWQADGHWHDDSWQESSWEDWSWDYSEESYAAKGKGKKGKKGKGKGKYGKDGKDGQGGSKDGAAQLADAAQSKISTTAATTFFVGHSNFYNLSVMATENHEAFITQPLTRTRAEVRGTTVYANAKRPTDETSKVFRLVKHRKCWLGTHRRCFRYTRGTRAIWVMG